MKTGVILAAGLGKRMNSKGHKVVHKVCGKPMIAQIVQEMRAVGLDRLFVVVGRLEEQVRAVLGDSVEYVRQAEQLGTGHAVLQALPSLPQDGITVVVYGDAPLIRREEIQRLIETAQQTGATTLMTAEVDDPQSFGRVVRATDGTIERIVEEKDATAEQRRIHEVNSGIYAFQTRHLHSVVPKLTPENAQRELLLTDCVLHLRDAGETVVPVVVRDADDIANVNDRIQLAVCEQKLRRRILLRHMQNGVTFIDPAATYVEPDVEIGRDTVVWPGSYLQGATVIGEDCVIGPDAQLMNARVGDGVEVIRSVVTDSRVGTGSFVGPFAYVRPGSDIGERVKVGDFVEIKNSTIGNHTKVSHLAYIGDSDVGTDVNVACGVVTANYDGFRKHRTIIGDDSFIGCNVNLVAPVEIGDGSYIATGSTITESVSAGSFAIARERQTTKAGYAVVLRERLEDGKK